MAQSVTLKSAECTSELELAIKIPYLTSRAEVWGLLWLFWGTIDRAQFYSIGFIETHTQLQHNQQSLCIIVKIVTAIKYKLYTEIYQNEML